MKTAGKNKKAERQASKKKSKTDSGKDIGEEMLKINKIKPEKKKKKPEAVEDVDPEKVLPTVESDKKLEAIVETARKVEKKSSKKDEVDDNSAFLSIATPAEDGLVPKVPSYSSEKNRGIVYISHIPHGFYEKQMREFFAQFGTVTNLRLGRSRKTGRSCGFAFVEFKYKEVAKVVSETMNNYLMFDKILKVSLLPEERMSPAVFRGKVMPSRPPGKAARIKAKKLHNAVKTSETVAKRQVRQVKKMNKGLKKLKEAGIQYEFKIAEMTV